MIGNDVRSGTVRFAADTVCRHTDAAVKSGNSCRLIEVQIGKVYDGPVDVRAG
jgi:hypothetical protein